ncbi:hypothetical protein MANES_07G068418v8 [Manihot esculenta]|uniref:Uncharacterized protein n=1 Tax=Manihot esculenta TaxID=3983 RepID=A0ACB7HEX9_MANES|nr:hypothetical protein MANES_07G068418v8 [Manihot esculenta]
MQRFIIGLYQFTSHPSSFFTQRIPSSLSNQIPNLHPSRLHLSSSSSLFIFISFQSRSHSHPPQSPVSQPPTGHTPCYPLAKASLFSPSFAASVPQPIDFVKGWVACQGWIFDKICCGEVISALRF